jgi:hypothetical protein
MSSRPTASARVESAVGPALLGLVFGGLLAYLIAQAGLAAYFDAPATEAARRKMTVPEYEAWRENRVPPTVVGFCVTGALLGAAVGGIAGAARPGDRHGRRRHGRGREPSEAVPLESLFTADQLQKLVSAALPFDLDGRTTDYFQGLLMGRLAEADPGLAHVIGRLRHLEVRELLARVRAEQSPGRGGAGRPGPDGG